MQKPRSAGSRLKRRKPASEKAVTASELLEFETTRDEETAEEKNARMSLLLSSIAEYTAKQNAYHEGPLLPNVTLLHHISNVLKKDHAPDVLSSAPAIPRVLLVAALKGVDEEGHTAGSGTFALVEALVHMTKGVNVEVPRDDNGRAHLRRSAFDANGVKQHSTRDLETMSRAGKWAAQLLADCVRGGRIVEGESNLSFAHSDISRIFVTPRDSLDAIMAHQYVDSIVEGLKQIPSLEVDLKQSYMMVQSVCSNLLPYLYLPWCVPIIEEILNVIATLPVPVMRDEAGDEPILSDDFLREIICEQKLDVFQSLSLKSRSIIIGYSERARGTFRRFIEKKICFEEGISAMEEVCIARPFAAACVKNVERHWELMDEVRREVSGTCGPFSLNLWKLRRFHRVVLGETLGLIHEERCSYSNGWKDCNEVTAAFRRFPRCFRQAVMGVMVLYGGMRGDKNLRNCQAGIVGVKLVHDVLKLDICIEISANVHSFLLCIEGPLERLCWGCTYWLSNRKNLRDDERDEILRKVAILIAVIDTLRLPGGACAEAREVIQRRVTGIRKALNEMHSSKRIGISGGEERVRVSGLFGMAISGLISGCDMKGLNKFCRQLNKEEAGEMARGLEMGVEWCGTEIEGKRCIEEVKKAIKVLQTEKDK